MVAASLPTLLVAVAFASAVEAFVFPHRHDICNKKICERSHACESSSLSWLPRGASLVRMSTPAETADVTEVLSLTLERSRWVGLVL